MIGHMSVGACDLYEDCIFVTTSSHHAKLKLKYGCSLQEMQSFVDTALMH